MKIILLMVAWLMMPIAFIVVAFDVAKASVESKLLAKLKEKNSE